MDLRRDDTRNFGRADARPRYGHQALSSLVVVWEADEVSLVGAAAGLAAQLDALG